MTSSIVKHKSIIYADCSCQIFQIKIWLLLVFNLALLKEKLRNHLQWKVSQVLFIILNSSYQEIKLKQWNRKLRFQLFGKHAFPNNQSPDYCVKFIVLKKYVVLLNWLINYQKTRSWLWHCLSFSWTYIWIIFQFPWSNSEEDLVDQNNLPVLY